MNRELRELLETDYQYGLEAIAADEAEARAAKESGDLAAYFDLTVNPLFPDTCWALEKWDEAKKHYRHNAEAMTKARAWHAKHSGPDYPIEELSASEASTLIKAGKLSAGREHLKRTIALLRDRPGSSLVLSSLGLHGAQAGLPDLATHARSVIEARLELPGESTKAARQARESLHYEPAEVCLLLGRWDEFKEELDKLTAACQIVQGKPEMAFPSPLQEALVAASLGLSALASLQSRNIKPELGQQQARQAFEEAMVHFHHFNGEVDSNIYFMRLNTRFADELAANRPLNPNPFADE